MCDGTLQCAGKLRLHASHSNQVDCRELPPSVEPPMRARDVVCPVGTKQSVAEIARALAGTNNPWLRQIRSPFVKAQDLHFRVHFELGRRAENATSVVCNRLCKQTLT